MSNLAEMWSRLEAHQSFADERGYGKEWRLMCEQRTEEATEAARAAACAAAEAAEEAAEAWAMAATEHIARAEEAT